MNPKQNTDTVKASRSSIRKAQWYYMFFRAGQGFTYGHATMLAPAMGIVLSSIYKTKEKLGEELKKYYFFFNTNIPFAGIIIGLLIGLEERRAKDPNNVPAESIQSTAVSLMGPIAGIGDIVQQGIVMPLILTIGISLSGTQDNPSMIGAIFCMISTSVVTVGMSYFFWMKSYDLGENFITKIFHTGLSDKLIKASTILGCMAMGGLLARYVTLTTSLAWFSDTSSFIFQTQLFDAIMPSLLPLITTMVILRALKKGMSPNKAVWITMLVVLILAVTGVFGPVPTEK